MCIRDRLWGFITRYAPEASAESHPLTDQLAGYALSYYEDFVKPAKVYRAPDDKERAAISDLADGLEAFATHLSEDKPPMDFKFQFGGARDSVPGYFNVLEGDEGLPAICQTMTFMVGKTHEFENLRDWFKALYEVLLGQSQGPRFGSFTALYGLQETAELIRSALARDAS